MSLRVHRTHPSPPFLQYLYPNLHGFKSTQRHFLCFWLYDLTMTKSRGKKGKKMSLFSGPSLSFYLPGSNIKIAISTIRKYLSPRDVGKVWDSAGSGPFRGSILEGISNALNTAGPRLGGERRELCLSESPAALLTHT